MPACSHAGHQCRATRGAVSLGTASTDRGHSRPSVLLQVHTYSLVTLFLEETSRENRDGSRHSATPGQKLRAGASPSGAHLLTRLGGNQLVPLGRTATRHTHKGNH